MLAIARGIPSLFDEFFLAWVFLNFPRVEGLSLLLARELVEVSPVPAERKGGGGWL